MESEVFSSPFQHGIADSPSHSFRQSRPHPDPLVKLFDLRMLRPLAPMPFPTGPAFINVHPKKPSLLTITSAQGLVNIVDITKPSDGGEFHQVRPHLCQFITPKCDLDVPLQIDVASYLSAVAISPDGSYMAFGDADGIIHTLTSTIDDERVPFNGFEGKPIEWADAPEPLPDISWDDRTYVKCHLMLFLLCEGLCVQASQPRRNAVL